MGTHRSIAISGDLGSGKSTVAAELSRRLGLRQISGGDIHRKVAQSRGMSALQLNRHSEHDAAIDAHIDRIQQDIARSGGPLIVDSRLGWYFFADAFKVHLKADPTLAARRVLARPASPTEAYASLEVAKQRLLERSESERARFIATYGVDKARLRNYSLVCDTTSASPDEVASTIIDAYEREPGDEPALYLDPARVYPTRLARVESDALESDALESEGPDTDGGERDVVRVGYARAHFFVVDGHARLRTAVERREHLIEAHLAAEADEPLRGSVSAQTYFESEVEPHGHRPKS